MTQRALALLHEALALPLQERADVAAELLASLDGTDEPVEDVQTAWAIEIEKRTRRLLAGESASRPWEEVRRRADEELRKR